MTASADTPFVWGGATPLRIAAAALSGLLLVAALVLVVTDPAYAWVWVPIALLAIWYALGMLRRKATLYADRIVAQGRFARREIPLAPLTQVAVAKGSTIWVRADRPISGSDPVCLLPQASKDPNIDGTDVSLTESVRRIRAAAEAAGAHLEPQPGGQVSPEPKKTRLFGF